VAQRPSEIGGVVPGSRDFTAVQDLLQPPADHADVARVIAGVLEAEEKAIAHYRVIIGAAAGIDPVTQDLAVSLLADEEAHRRTFRGFAREYDLDRA
jgi:bacterioferritin